MEEIDSEERFTLLIERIKRNADIKTDAEMAKMLGVTKAAISEWRSGRSKIGIMTKIRILDIVGFQGARAMILALFPKETADQIIQANNDLTRKFNNRKSDIDNDNDILK